RSRPAERGSVLMITLFIAVILGITLGSYLLMIRAQSISLVRSEAWNAALVMAEAGVEEALAQLNPGVSSSPIDPSANGWGNSAPQVYGPVSRRLPGGSYSVIISNAAPSGSPAYVIYSAGYVAVPTVSATNSRIVKVTTSNAVSLNASTGNAPLFATAVAARTDIDLDYKGVFSDSFNSTTD